MKKNKAKLREKIRNRPTARNSSKRKKKAGAQKPLTEDFQRDAPQIEEEDTAAMSQVVLDFAAPLLETCNDKAAERKAISLAIYVWNSAMLPESQCRRILEDYLGECQKVMPPEELETLSDYIDRLVQTRTTQYAHNRKKITNCTFGDFGADRHIEVGYTME